MNVKNPDINVSGTSLSDFRKKIWALEKESKLLKVESGGVFVWQAFKFSIFNRLAKELNIIDSPHRVKTNKSVKTKLLTLYSRLSFFKKDPLVVAKPVNDELKSCVIEHPRSVEYEGKNMDVYSHKLTRSLDESQVPFIRLDIGGSGYVVKTQSPNRYYIDLMFTLVELTSLFLYILPLRRNSGIFHVSRVLTDKFQTSDTTSFLKWNLIKFRLYRLLYRRVFTRFNINRLFVVVSYECAPAICAAKSLGIEVVELQHGVISKYHPGYGLSDTESEMAYLPEKFYAWSDFWRKSYDELKLPVKSINYGFPFLYERLEKYLGIPKNKNKIVVISQGSIGNKLADFIYRNSVELKDCEIAYKLHPGEYECWKEYPNLVKLSELENVVIIKSCNLYELLSCSSYMVGVYSTVVYEALELGVKPVLVDLPGIEYMEELLSSGDAIMFENFLRIKGIKS